MSRPIDNSYNLPPDQEQVDNAALPDGLSIPAPPGVSFLPNDESLPVYTGPTPQSVKKQADKQLQSIEKQASSLLNTISKYKTIGMVGIGVFVLLILSVFGLSIFSVFLYFRMKKNK